MRTPSGRAGGPRRRRGPSGRSRRRERLSRRALWCDGARWRTGWTTRRSTGPCSRGRACSSGWTCRSSTRSRRSGPSRPSTGRRPGPRSGRGAPATRRAALGTRVAGVEAADMYGALDRRELVTWSLLRGTIHLVSAREHPAYAAVAEASGALDWRRVDTSEAPSAAQLALPAAVAAHCAEPRAGEDLAAVVEAWVEANPGALSEAELARQRESSS